MDNQKHYILWAKTVLFTQADIQKEILKELQLLRNGKQMNNADAMKDDFRIDFDKIDCWYFSDADM